MTISPFSDSHLKWRENMIGRLKNVLPPPLVHHSLMVEEIAVDLARRWDVDAEKASTAALLHDCVKPVPKDVLLKEAKEFGIVITEIEQHNESLLHAPVGAEIASTKWGIEDQDVLNAIRYHTTGRAGMTVLEQVIYIADAIEPDRDYPEVNQLRELASQDLSEACLKTMDGTLCYVIRHGWLVHPRSVDARNWLLMSR